MLTPIQIENVNTYIKALNVFTKPFEKEHTVTQDRVDVVYSNIPIRCYHQYADLVLSLITLSKSFGIIVTISSDGDTFGLQLRSAGRPSRTDCVNTATGDFGVDDPNTPMGNSDLKPHTHYHWNGEPFIWWY